MRVLHAVSVINLAIIGVLASTPFQFQFHPQTCIVNVELTQKLNNEGFHRILSYDIEFSLDSLHDKQYYNGCNITLHQPLPAGLYVNNDELLELRAMKKLRAGVMNPGSIELPAEEATPMNVVMMGPIVDSKVSLWVPVHARYHSAKPGGCGAEGMCPPDSGFARNTIEQPNMFIQCPDHRLNVDNTQPCELEYAEDMDLYKHINLKPLPYKKLTPRIHWDVPVGNTDHYNLVTTVTMATICIGSVYLLWSLHDYKVKTNLKKKDN